MPLETYQRGKTWWARGRVEYAGKPVTPYLRESTGTSTAAAAAAWCEEREAQAIRHHLFGPDEENRLLTFAELVLMYDASPADAGYLEPIVNEIGAALVKHITPASVRVLAAKLYPNTSTDTWQRQVITPIRAVINNAHEALGGDRVPSIRFREFSPDERRAQDRKRGKQSRVEKTPGSWPWILAFHAAARPNVGALALFMFMTGARVGQAVEMHPDRHLDLQNARVCIPGAKGHDDRWIEIPMELVVELANLKPRVPRGWKRNRDNLRVFGYATRWSVYKSWAAAEVAAGIEHLPPHSAGRHGFGQEMRVRQTTDKKAVERFGGWSPNSNILDRTYTHEEDTTVKVHRALRTGRVQAEKATGLKLVK